MGIVSGIVGAVTGLFKTREEPKGEEPVKIVVVEPKKSNWEQVHDWIEKGEETDRVRRIRERASYDQIISDGGSPSYALRTIEHEREQRIASLRGEKKDKKIRNNQSKKTGSIAKKFMKILTGSQSGKRSRLPKGYYRPRSDVQVNAIRNGKKAALNFDLGFKEGGGKSKKGMDFNFNFGKWKL